MYSVYILSHDLIGIILHTFGKLMLLYILYSFLFLLLSVCIVFTALLALPIRLFVRLEKTNSPLAIRMEIAPLCGLLGVGYEQQAGLKWYYILLSNREIVKRPYKKKLKPPKKKKIKKPEKKLPEKKKTLTEKINNLWEMKKEFSQPFIKTVKKVLKSVNFRESVIDFTFGTGNPALTGKLYGTLVVLQKIFSKKLKIQVKPDFLNTGINGKFQMKVDFYLWRFIRCVWPLGKAILIKYWKDRKLKRIHKYKTNNISHAA